MEIKDLKPNQGNVDLVVEVVEKKPARTFEKFGKSGKVCNAVVKDATGQVVLTLWNEDIEKVNVGDTIRVKNGWCSAYKEENQVSPGKFGSVEVVKKAMPVVFTNDPGIFQQDEEEETVPEADEEFVDE